jgi:hypothetical protein
LRLWVKDSKFHHHGLTLLGVQTLAEVMEKYIGHGRTTELGPPDKNGFGWLLVPRLDKQKRPTYDRQNEEDLEDYVLVRAKPQAIPKDARYSPKPRGAKLFNLKSGNTRDHMTVMLTKAYAYVQMYDSSVEFHVKYDSSLRGVGEMAQLQGGLSFRPELIAKSLGAFLSVQPLTDGFYVVFVMSKKTKNRGSTERATVAKGEKKLTQSFKFLRGLEAVGKVTLKKERKKDKDIRLRREDADIERLKEQGEAYEHILEQRQKLEERRTEIRDHFARQHLERKLRDRLKVETKKRLKRQRYEEELAKRRMWKENKERRNSEQQDWAQRAELYRHRSSYFATGAEQQGREVDRYSRMDNSIYSTAETDLEETEPDRYSAMGDSIYPTAETEHQGTEPDRFARIDSSIQHARSVEEPSPGYYRSIQPSVPDDAVESNPLIRYHVTGKVIRKVLVPEIDTSLERLRKIETGDWDSPAERPVTVRRVMDTEYPPVHASMSAESAKVSSQRDPVHSFMSAESKNVSPQIDPVIGVDKRSLLYHYSGDSALRRVENPDRSYWNRAQRQGHRSIF